MELVARILNTCISKKARGGRPAPLGRVLTGVVVKLRRERTCNGYAAVIPD